MLSLASAGATAPAEAAGAQDIVAIRGQQRVTRAAFQRDVAALAALLPAHRHVLNMCTDRYRFMVGLAAARARGQVSLLPPSDAPAVVLAVAADHPDVYALTDGPPLPLPSLAFPNDLDAGAVDTPASEDAAAAAAPAITLFTSGSTGRPQPVVKDWGVLVRSAASAGKRLDIAALRGATLIGTVPHQHSYGLESLILLGLQHGLAIDTGWPLYPVDIRAAIARAARPRILVATPVHLAALLAEPADMPPVDLLLSATAPLDPALAAQAEACFGAPLIEIYGCTEAGQIATRRTAREQEWHCLDGVVLTRDAQGCWASGPAVPGRALLQDVIEPTGADTFRLGGRAADLVNIAGKRTSLAHLNHQLLGIAGVRDGTFLMDEQDGQRIPRLMALAVAPGVAPAFIQSALRQRIDAAFLPRPLVLVDRLPRTTLGKLPRQELLRLVRDRPR